MPENESTWGNVCRPVYIHKSTSYTHTHPYVQSILYECDLELITSLLSHCVLDPLSEIMNNYHVTLQPSNILVCFLFEGNLILPTFHWTVLPRNVMANITLNNYINVFERERGAKKEHYLRWRTPQLIWQISEVKIYLESHQLDRKKATGRLDRSYYT